MKNKGQKQDYMKMDSFISHSGIVVVFCIMYCGIIVFLNLVNVTVWDVFLLFLILFINFIPPSTILYPEVEKGWNHTLESGKGSPWWTCLIDYIFI